MNRTRFNECLNREVRFFNISIGTIIGAVTVGLLVWSFKSLLYGVGAGAIGAIYGSWLMKQYVSGAMQRGIYWRVLNSQKFFSKRTPPSYQQRLM